MTPDHLTDAGTQSAPPRRWNHIVARARPVQRQRCGSPLLQRPGCCPGPALLGEHCSSRADPPARVGRYERLPVVMAWTFSPAPARKDQDPDKPGRALRTRLAFSGAGPVPAGASAGPTVKASELSVAGHLQADRAPGTLIASPPGVGQSMAVQAVATVEFRPTIVECQAHRQSPLAAFWPGQAPWPCRASSAEVICAPIPRFGIAWNRLSDLEGIWRPSGFTGSQGGSLYHGIYSRL